MPDIIFSREIDLHGYKLRNFVLNPITTVDRLAISLTTEDEGFAVWDLDLTAPYYWDGTQWISWPGGGTGFPTITYDDLQSLTGGSTTIPYWMTTPGKEGFWMYSGTVLDQSSDNEGTVIVTSDLKQYKRVYDGSLDIRWFGGVADFAAAGNNMTGTNNISALNKMFAAAGDNQPMIIPDVGTAWYFNGSANTIGNSKIVNLTIYGDTYHFLATPSTPFLEIQNSGKEHKIHHKGRAFGKLGIPDISKANYDANSGPDWSTFNGIFLRVFDSLKPDLEIPFADGFAEVLRLEGGIGANAGTQEVTCRFKWWYRNKYGVRFVVTDGTGYVDKCNIYGGTIMGQYPISFEGNLNGVSKTGVFTANSFYNVLIESADNGITGNGVIRYNQFIGCQIEGGSDTGVFSDKKIDLGSAAFANNFAGLESISADWLSGPDNNPGEHLMSFGSPIFSSDGIIVGSALLGGIDNGRVTLLGTVGISDATRGNIPSTVDVITLLGTSPESNQIRKNEFARIRVEGVDQSVSYDGKTVNVTGSGTTLLVPPTGFVRLAAGAGAVTLSIDQTQLFNGNRFFIEQTGTGTVQIINSNDSSVVMNTSQITSTGYYLVRYFGGSFSATKLGGAGSSSLTLGAVGSSPNANGGTITGTTLTLQPADPSFPGLMTPLTQSFTGNKTFGGDVSVRKTTATTLTVETTSATESTLASLDILNTVGAAQFRVNNNSIIQLGRKDNTATAAITLANGKVFGSGRQWSLGINPGNNHLILNNQSISANVLSVQSANNNVRIGTSTADPGFKLQVDGSLKIFADSLYLGQLSAEPGVGINGQVYYNTTLNKFRAYEAGVWVDMIGGGGGGGGVNAVGAVGAGNANGGSISGTTLTLHVATSTQPGLWSTTTQTLPGNKTFTGTLNLRTGSVSSGTAPVKIPEASALMNVQENGAIERFGNDLWFTNATTRQKIITSNNVAILSNKTWQGQPIDPAYGGKDIAFEDAKPTSYTMGTGAGTSPTNGSPATNTNADGVIVLTTGTAPASNNIIITVNYSSPVTANGSVVVFSPANQAAASVASSTWAVTNGTTSFSLRSSTALAASTQYQWHYHVRKLPSVVT